MSLYQLQLANQVLSLLYSTYSFLSPSLPSSSSSSPLKENKPDLSLDQGEMNHMLKWMALFFSDLDHSAHPDPYQQELYNLFVTIRSDYHGYLEHVRYNQSLWLFPNYRRRNLDTLAHKIKTDLKMFTQALQLFAWMKNRKNNYTDECNNKNECSPGPS